MELQFSANQEYQLDAIDSVVRLFDGQLQAVGASELAVQGLLGLTLTEKGLSNGLTLNAEQLLANSRKVQAGNNLPESDALLPLTLESGQMLDPFPNFTVEMETGTGKTYVYLRTIYELNKQYGFKKIGRAHV